MIDRIRRSLSPVYEKVNQNKKYVKFTNKINIFIINKAQNKSFAHGPKIFKTALLAGKKK